jgi:hypothetical protein
VKILVLWLGIVALSHAQRMTDIQVLGSHNSYHAGLAPSEKAYWMKANPQLAASLDYSHPSLTEQLNLGVRKVELDIFSDSQGGLFANPAAPRLLAKEGLPADPDFDPGGKMKQPGWKVIHVQDIDYRSNCQPLVECLTQLRDWSKAHPRHLPIYVLLETKSGNPRPDFMVNPEPVTAASLDTLEAEILSVFPRSHLITPDDVRGGLPTLEQAVLTRGWPLLEQARGKLVFLFDQENVTPLYTKGRPSLEGRLIFTNAKPGQPGAAFLKLNDPTSPQIAEMVKKGYLVRTMSDGGVEAVRQNDTKRRDAALASGAHIVSTDYYFTKRAPSGYGVDLGGGIARCNPVRAPQCNAKALGED